MSNNDYLKYQAWKTDVVEIATNRGTLWTLGDDGGDDGFLRECYDDGMDALGAVLAAEGKE